MKLSRNLLRWLTLGALLCVAAAALKLQSLSHWSAEMERRMAVGLPDHFDQPVLFAELARNKADFEAVFGSQADKADEADKQEKTDVEVVEDSLFYDRYFISSYTLLLILLGLRCWQQEPRPWYAPVLLILPPVIGACDMMENGGILNALHHLKDQTLTDGMISATRDWSMMKWLLFFADLLLLGQNLMGTREDNNGSFPQVLQRATALLLVLGGFAGVLGVACWPQMVATGFSISMLAMAPLLGLVFFPDKAWGGPRKTGLETDEAGHERTEPAERAAEYASY